MEYVIMARGLLLGSVLLLSSLPARAVDGDWPRRVESPQAAIVLYQPQPETLRGNIIAARIAVAVTLRGSANPVYGAVWISSRVETDRDQRTVTIADLTVTGMKFPNATSEQQRQLSRILETEVPRWRLTLSLDRLEASLLNAEMETASAEGLRATPPQILFVSVPTILVSIDGEPLLRPIANTTLQRVVNTPFPLLYDPATRSYYLNGGALWYRAASVRGPWTLIDSPPPAVAAVVPSEQDAAANSGSASGLPPRILVATEPTELIVMDGAPQYASIPGTDLLYMTNTESDVFLEINTQQYYLLLSGRWYRGASLDGPWSSLRADQLPDSFQRIPPASAQGDVRPHVAGTEEARLAVIDAQIPQTATLPRGEARLNVTYDGSPQFQPIPGTAIEYAVNTSASVLKISGRYYACEQGAWYVSPSPTGPWTVATAVPPEVQSIPPSCPLYNTRFVYVYQYTPSVVYVGYTPGYLGCYPWDGVVVWGTGYSYTPWVGVYYYPWSATWGFHAGYHSWAGWTFGLSYNTGPFRSDFAWGRRHRDSDHGGRWGPGGYRGPTYVNVHNNWLRFKSPSFNPIDRGHNLYVSGRRESAPRDLQPRRGPAVTAPRVAPGQANDVFANRDGGIYRRTDQGWQIRGRGNWTPGSPGGAVRPPAGGSPGPSLPGVRPIPSIPPGTRPIPSVLPGTRPIPSPAPGNPSPRSGLPTPGTRPIPSPAPGGSNRRPDLFPRDGTRGDPTPAPRLNPNPLERDYRAREMGRSREGSFRNQGFGGRPGGFGGSPRGGSDSKTRGSEGGRGGGRR